MSRQAERRTTLITGASSGIGLALAHRLAVSDELILTGRRPVSELNGALPSRTSYVDADFTEPVLAVQQIAAHLDQRGTGSLQRLILCAGTGRYGAIDTEDPDSVAATLAVNLRAPILMAATFAHLLEKGGGKVVFIGSVAHRGSASMPTYAASKAGLTGFARSLHAEWQGRIGVQIIHPGPTATAMHQRAGYDPGRLQKFFLSDRLAAATIARLMNGKTPAARVCSGALLREFLAAALR